VDWATANGTASAPGDYLANSGTLTFAAGQTTRTITVVVNGDTINETDETFFVNLNNAVNAIISDAQGVVTIANDGCSASAHHQQRHAGRRQQRHDQRSPHRQPLRGQLLAGLRGLGDCEWHGKCTGDYLAISGTLAFAAGQTTRTITVVVNGDTINETDENLLRKPEQRRQRHHQLMLKGVVTIGNDDALPQLTINNITLAEGNSGTTNAVLTVSSLRPALCRFRSIGRPANGTASAPGDYLANSGTLTFAAGQTTRTHHRRRQRRHHQPRLMKRSL